VAPGSRGGEETLVRIDCSQCEMYRSEHCQDCLVTALLHPPNDVAEIDDDVGECLQTLSGAGLIPVLRFRPRAEIAEAKEEAASTIAEWQKPSPPRSSRSA